MAHAWDENDGVFELTMRCTVFVCTQYVITRDRLWGYSATIPACTHTHTPEKPVDSKLGGRTTSATHKRDHHRQDTETTVRGYHSVRT